MHDRPRRILLVSSNLPPVVGGSTVIYEQLCRNAPEHLVALGARRQYETGRLFDGVGEYDAHCGYPIHRVDTLRPVAVAKRSGPGSRVISFLLDDLPVMTRTLATILALLIRYRVAVVCLGELVSLGWLTVPLRYLFRRTVIIYTHGEEVSQSSDSTSARLRRFYLRHADRIVAVSIFCKSVIVSKYEVDPAKVFVISNGVDLDTFRRGICDRTVLPAALRGKKLILSVSRLVERKGHDKLIEAMPAILRQVPEAHLLVVGDGPLAQHLAALVAEAKLEDDVSFLGSVSMERMVALYRAADVFALTCRTLPDGDTEGFGLVFLEANACGVPVLAGVAGGTVEAVVAGETGLLVDSAESKEIAAAMTSLLTDTALAHRLAEGGWRRAQQYGWAKVTRSFIQLCRGELAQQEAASYQSLDIALTPKKDHTAPPRLLVTVDVEEEFRWTEFSRSDHRVRGLEALSAFQEPCHTIGIAPVYLVTYAIMQDADFCKFLRRALENGVAEVGIHLHGWTTPPFWEQPNVFNSYQCNLPEHIERRKLETLCRLFEDRFGTAPVIHRAGRWGGNDKTARLIEAMGFRIDLSPSQGYDDVAHGGPDFSNLDGRPFWTGPGRRVLTIPVSSLRHIRGPGWLSRYFYASNYMRSSLGARWGAGTSVRFSPESQPLSDLSSMARQFVRQRNPVVVCSLHSTSLYGGGNPYARTQADAVALSARAGALLSYCVETLGMRPATCKTLLADAEAARDSPASLPARAREAVAAVT